MKKIPTALSTEISSRKCSLPKEFPAESAGYELVPISSSNATIEQAAIQPEIVQTPDDCADDYQRIREEDQTGGCWDEVSGEYVRTPSSKTQKADARAC